MRMIRASEIGTYLFCKRAWWYREQGAKSENQEELAGGSLYHRRHGRNILAASLLRLAGWVLLLVALVVLAVWLTSMFIQ